MDVCERCGGTEQVRFGLCLDCTRARRKGAKAKSAEEQVPPAPPLEPPHSRPWVHRGGG